MTRLQKLDRKIRRTRDQLKLAEGFYHFATVHGCIAERDRALQACQELRLKLEALRLEREKLTGRWK